jgi:tetrathionate reductase subunit C
MVAVYLFFVGVSAGSYVLASLPFALGLRRYEPLSKLALISAIIFAILAPLAITPHLTQPSRLFSLLFSFHQTSPLSWGTYILSAYVLAMLAYGRFSFRGDLIQRMEEESGLKASFYRALALWQTSLSEESLKTDRKFAKVSGYVALALAFLTVYTGFELGVIRAQPLWHLSISPIMFLLTALSSGFAFALSLYLVAERYFSKTRRWNMEATSGVSILLAWLLAAFLVLNAMQAILSQYTTADARFAFEYLVTGPLSTTFVWVGILLGGVVPFLIFTMPVTRKSPQLVLVGSALALVGSFATKYGVLISAQLVPKTGTTFLAYTPSLIEFAEFAGVVSLGAFLFTVVLWVLPWQQRFRLGVGV